MRNIFEIKDNFSIYKDYESVLEVGNLDNCLNPEVTIIIPCYNHPKFLKKALLSAINQDYSGQYEIVIVDDDDSKKITLNREIVEELNSPKVLYYHNKQNLGMFGNWNRCIELARAPYLTILHDDDMLLPSCLTTLMSYVKDNPKKAILGIRNYIDENDVITYKSPFEGKKNFILKYKDCKEVKLINHYILPLGYCIGSLFRKDNLIRIGGFSPEFYPLADSALASLYIKEYGAIQPLKATHNYRISENDSFKTYAQFSTCLQHIRNCMKPFIKYPDFLLDIIAKALNNCSSYDLEQSFSKGNYKIKKPKWTDRSISKLCLHIEGLSKYKLF